MRKQTTTRVLAAVAALIVVFYIGVQVGNGRIHVARKTQTGLPATLDYSQLNTLYTALRENYSGKLTGQQVMDGLKHGLANSAADPYTVYFTAKEAKQFSTDLSGQTLTGIGAQLDQDSDGNIIIMAPLDGSPAKAAGIQAKDIIASINGQTTAGMSVNTAVDKIRGKKGSKVALVIIRGQQQLSFTITRGVITVPNATSRILPGNIGYLQISQFSDGDTDGANSSYALAQQAVQRFKQAGVKKIILDLRDNPGGEVDSAVNISSLWLPADATVATQKGTENATYTSTGNNPLKGMPTVVLVNGGSASASEITTLALRDAGAAYVMGEKSYGKGVVQSVIPFSDGSELKVTVAKWYSPKGTNINHKGIVPDQIVIAGTNSDTQLAAAETYLTTH